MQYAHCLVRDVVLAIASGHFVESPFFINDTYIHAARNRAVHEFMKTGMDYLMFIDADMGWSPGALVDMLSLPSGMDVVGGVYCVKEDVPRFPVTLLPNAPVEFPICELKGVATGFMRITRSCLERALNKFPSGKLFNHIEDPSIKGGEWGDDFAFCIRAREAGCKVYGKFDLAFEHVGPKVWSGKASDHVWPVEIRSAA